MERLIEVVGWDVNEFTIRKAGQIIGSPEEWLKLAPPPEPESQWGPGQAEGEWARSFFDGSGSVQVPQALGAILLSHPLLGAVRLQGLIPEYRIKLDDSPGGSQRAQGLAVGTCREGRVAVMIHVRTDGGFGPLMADQLRRSKPGSQTLARLTRMTEAVLGTTPVAAGALRAGLVLLAAAALRAAETEKAGTAVLLFHEFRPKLSRPHQLQQNSTGLDAFAAALGGKPLKPGVLSGAFRVPGGNEVPASVPLYLGKTITLL